MTIDEAIQRFANSRDECLNSATETYQKFLNYQDQYYKDTSQTLEKTAMEFDQIAEWLKELKELREQNSPSRMSGTSDLISRQRMFDLFDAWEAAELDHHIPKILRDRLKTIPSAQPEPLSDAYTKAVWTWLLDYQIKAAELKGRYTPYEVLSWVTNDWKKEHDIIEEDQDEDDKSTDNT